MENSYVERRTGPFALLSGVIGLIAVAFLIAALLAPTPSPDTMRRETDFFRWQDAGVILQAITMIPMTLGIYHFTSKQDRSWSRACLAFGLFAQASLVISSALIFTHTASDMLYMGPVGLVGLWLVMVNRKGFTFLSNPLVWTGRVAGTGLLIIGVGFLIYGLFVAPAVFVRPLSNAEIDAQSLTLANLVAHICIAAGTLLGRLIYPFWALLLGRKLLA